MRVLSTPGRLRLATAALFLCIPLAAIEIVIASKLPWWRIPARTLGMWSLSIFLICVPLAAWLSAGRRWALQLTTLFLSAWVILSGWIAIRNHNTSVGFYAILLAFLFLTEMRWVRREMGRSFYDPLLPWFQGLPKPIPGLVCQLNVGGGDAFPVQVSRMDREGAFLFHAREPLPALKSGQRFDVDFDFRNRKFHCQARPMRALSTGLGAGFQFQGLSADLRKELGDFVEVLRGEGYV
ncbi:MAG: hypothetical protein ACXWPM_13025 [Bdellovibrionota bacterium]